jgi:class 3 adenylate cyclase
MIERDKADEIQREFRRTQVPNINNPAPKKWFAKPMTPPYYKDGAWWFIYESPGVRKDGIVVRDDGNAHVLLGAMASAYYSNPSKVGLPRSSERFLGSTSQGRYQLFDGGIVVWEVPDKNDLAYYIPPLEVSGTVGGRRVNGLTAFFDLRGFTSWSKGKKVDNIQSLIEQMEHILQTAFGRDFEGNLFFKWTGDGAMVVSEEMRSNDFSQACCRGVIGISRILRGDFEDLAVGCGITKGEVTQLFMFGRHDYIGDVVNEASKLQQFAWNEICLAREVHDLLLAEEVVMQNAKRMGAKGYRIDPEAFLEALVIAKAARSA